MQVEAMALLVCLFTMFAVTSLVLLFALHLRKCKGAPHCDPVIVIDSITLLNFKRNVGAPFYMVLWADCVASYRYICCDMLQFCFASSIMRIFQWYMQTYLLMCVCVYVRFMLDKANYSFIINKQQTIVIQTWALSNSFDFGPLFWLVERTLLICADTSRYIHMYVFVPMYICTYIYVDVCTHFYGT